MLTKAWRGVADYFVALWDYRHFWISLVGAELRRRYRRSILGVGWSLLQPICMTIVLALVYRRIFQISFWDFGPMLLTGLAFWNLTTQTVLGGCGALVSAEPYIRQRPLPLAIFPLRVALTIGFHFLISLSLAFFFVFAVNGLPNPVALLTLVPTLILLFLFAWSLALVAGFTHVYFPDTQHLAEVCLQVLMFLTPVMYPTRLLTQNGLGFLLYCNPLAILLNLIRDPLLHGQVPSLTNFLLAGLFVSILMSLAMWMVARFERRLIFAL